MLSLNHRKDLSTHLSMSSNRHTSNNSMTMNLRTIQKEALQHSSIGRSRTYFNGGIHVTFHHFDRWLLILSLYLQCPQNLSEYLASQRGHGLMTVMRSDPSRLRLYNASSSGRYRVYTTSEAEAATSYSTNQMAPFCLVRES